MNNNKEKKPEKEFREIEEEISEEREKTNLLETFLNYEGKDEVITSRQAFEAIQKKTPSSEKFLSGITKLDELWSGK